MSSIRQYQRRALEALKPEKVAISFSVSKKDEETLFYVQRRVKGKVRFERIYLLGISEGVGTCSDLEGINIAVFGLKKPLSTQLPKNIEEVICEWAALVKTPTRQEIKQGWAEKKDTPCLMAEGINVYKIEDKVGTFNKTYVYFVLTGKKKLYANTIC